MDIQTVKALTANLPTINEKAPESSPKSFSTKGNPIPKGEAKVAEKAPEAVETTI